jgi:hypothetical protein
MPHIIDLFFEEYKDKIKDADTWRILELFLEYLTKMKWVKE